MREEPVKNSRFLFRLFLSRVGRLSEEPLQHGKPVLWQMDEIHCDTCRIAHYPCIVIFRNFKSFACLDKPFVSLTVTDHHFP